ncbi:MAG: hypothetical protein ACYC3H_08380 [Bellilinea sp.]
MIITRGRYPNINLIQGRSRKLYNSEIYRGFLFITGSKIRDQFIDDKNLTVYFQDQVITNKKLDKAGRLHLGTQYFANIPFQTIVNITIVDKNTVKVTFNI